MWALEKRHLLMSLLFSGLVFSRFALTYFLNLTSDSPFPLHALVTIHVNWNNNFKMNNVRVRNQWFAECEPFHSFYCYCYWLWMVLRKSLSFRSTIYQIITQRRKSFLKRSTCFNPIKEIKTPVRSMREMSFRPQQTYSILLECKTNFPYGLVKCARKTTLVEWNDNGQFRCDV